MSKSEKGIFVTIRFWTDFKKKDGTRYTIPRQGWAAGTLYVRASTVHGIKSGDAVMFNNLEEFMVKLDQLLRQHNITLGMSDTKGNFTPRLGKLYPKETWSGW